MNHLRLVQQDKVRRWQADGFGPFTDLHVDRPEVGLRITRGEDCLRCKRWTSHVFTLLSVKPRMWGYACLDCRAARVELAGN